MESFDFYHDAIFGQLVVAAESITAPAIASMMEDNSTAVAPSDEPKDTFTMSVSCCNYSCTVAAPVDVPVDTTLDVESTSFFDSFEIDPPGTVQASSI